MKKKIDAETMTAISNLIIYMYDDEKKHWEECDKPRKEHIFLDVRKVDKWLRSNGL